MWRSSAVVAVAAALVASCGSAPPEAVDVEGPALDIAACARHDASCTVTGNVVPSGSMLPPEGGWVTLDAPATIAAPLIVAAPGERLFWIAIGLRTTFGPANCGNDARQTPCNRALRVTVTGHDPILVRPLPTFSRVEVDLGSYKPPDGARIEIEAVQGTFDIGYVVGRWNR